MPRSGCGCRSRRNGAQIVVLHGPFEPEPGCAATDPHVTGVTGTGVVPAHDHVPPDQVLPDQVLSDQDEPDHVLPDHVDPDHVLPDHVDPDHVLPDHELPDQLDPDHVLPDQVLPDQDEPFHKPPIHEVPAAVLLATVAEMNGLPKMSFSPVRVTPPVVTWSVPRAASRLPVPAAAAKFCV